MIETVMIATPNGPQMAAVAIPKTEGPHPAILICHEWWGLNDDMRRMAERFAGEGFLAIALDFYEGKSTADPGEAMQLVMQLKTDHALVVTKAAVDKIKSDPRCTGRIAITGFCLGGAMAIAAICNVEGIAAAVPFYGLPMPKFQNWQNVKGPILGHYAQNDSHVPAEKVQGVVDSARQAGVTFECHFYSGSHGFMRKSDAAIYHPESADLAWNRTLAFLKQHAAS
ncbi:MAG TPA: dienelactone hydrolase family protein [Pseudomonadota bacterium]|nr:dienelactone hydrolase family protein [Pseudomonadota bacterium]